MAAHSPFFIGVAMATLCFTSCGGEGKASVEQPKREAEGAIRARVPVGWTIRKVSLTEFTPGPMTGAVGSTFSIEVSPLETMVTVLESIEGTNVVRELLRTDQSVTMYGRIVAQKRGEIWIAEAKIEGDGLPGGTARPLGTLHPYVLAESPQLALFLAEVKARAATLAEAMVAKESAILQANAQIRQARAAAEEEARVAATRAEDERQKHERDALLLAIEKKKMDAQVARRKWLAPFRSPNGVGLFPAGSGSRMRLLLVEKLDQDEVTVSGTGVDFTKLPSSAFTFRGQIGEYDGHELFRVSSSDESEPVDFNERLDNGSLIGRSARALGLGKVERQEIDAFKKAAEGASVETVVKGGSWRVAPLSSTSNYLSSITPVFFTGDILEYKTSGNASVMFDGKIDGGDVSLYSGSWINIRLNQAQRVKSLLLVIDDAKYGGVKSSNLIVNGVRIQIPEMVEKRDGMAMLTWPQPIDILELQFDTFDQAGFVEAFFLR